MRARIEKTDGSRPEEVVIYCQEATPEIESLVQMIKRLETGRQQLVFLKGEEQYYLSLKELLFFETDGDRVYAHTVDQSYEVKMRLYELESMLPGYFVRASRSAIVSILHVFSVQKGLTGLSLLSFRESHKEVYCSRIAFVVYIWQEQLGLQQVDLWLLILASVVLSIGLSIIFQKKHHFHKRVMKDNWSKADEVINDEEHVSIDCSFGEQTKYIHASNLKEVLISGNFSAQKVFFDQCQISQEGLKIEVSANFCEITINMPREWRIIQEANVFAGSVKEGDTLPADVRIPVQLRGSVNFAEVKINYI